MHDTATGRWTSLRITTERIPPRTHQFVGDRNNLCLGFATTGTVLRAPPGLSVPLFEAALADVLFLVTPTSISGQVAGSTAVGFQAGRLSRHRPELSARSRLAHSGAPPLACVPNEKPTKGASWRAFISLGGLPLSWNLKKVSVATPCERLREYVRSRRDATTICDHEGRKFHPAPGVLKCNVSKINVAPCLQCGYPSTHSPIMAGPADGAGTLSVEQSNQ